MNNDLYESITNEVIASLEDGNPVWKKSWKSSIAVPHNASTGREYNGINILITWLECSKHDYKTNGWLTWNQCEKLGGKVKADQRKKYTYIIHFKTVKFEDKKTGEEKTFPKLTTWRVYNVDQCEGLEDSDLKTHAELDENCIDIDPASVSLSIAQANNIDVEHDKSFNPCFIPSKDKVLMPLFGAFNTAEDYEATALHEYVHWTKKKNRLDRKMDSYAEEELVAELGSAFLCAKLNINSEHAQHKSYIENWLKALRNDKKLIFKASTQAQKAVRFLLNKKKGVK